MIKKQILFTVEEKQEFLFELESKIPNLLKNLEKSIQDNQIAINECMLVINHSNHNRKHDTINNWNDMEKLWNIVGYIASIDYDIKIATSILLQVKDDKEKSIIARSLIIAVYEGRKDLSDLLGANLKELLDGLDMPDSLFNQIKFVSKELGKFNKEYGVILGHYRDNISAHRGWKNFARYIKDVQELDWVEILQISIYFSKIVHNIAAVLQDIANQTVQKFTK